MTSGFKVHRRPRSRRRDPGKTVLGKRIRETRRRLGLTQERLAETAGMDPKYLAEIERAEPRANPTVRTLLKIAKALSTPLEGLFADLPLEAGRPKPAALRREIVQVVSDASPRALYTVLRIAKVVTGK